MMHETLNSRLAKLPTPQVSLVMPLRQEEQHIAQCLESLLLTTFPVSHLELIIVDGQSTDATPQLIRSFAEKVSFPVRILENPKKIVPTAMNIGIKAAQAPYVIRLDAHTQYDQNYITQCFLLLESGIASNVGGAMRPLAQGFISHLVALATTSFAGIGNSSFHFTETEGFVDTVYLGAFVKKDLIEVGMYDEELVRNQDDELNLRLIRAGKKIFISPLILSSYTPRSSLIKLAVQYYQYGFWKVRVIQKHKYLVSLRHLAPTLLLLGLSTSLGGALFFPQNLIFFLYLPGLYIFFLIFGSLHSLFRFKDIYSLALAPVYMCLHFSYGLGFLKGLVYWYSKKKF